MTTTKDTSPASAAEDGDALAAHRAFEDDVVDVRQGSACRHVAKRQESQR